MAITGALTLLQKLQKLFGVKTCPSMHWLPFKELSEVLV